MIELKGEIIGLQEDFISGQGIVTLKVEKAYLKPLSALSDALSIKFSKYSKKRSLNANAYCWKLCTEIANVLTRSGDVVTKDDVYLRMLKDYGQSDIVTLRADIEPSLFFDYYDERGRGEINGKEYVHYKVTIGSSKYRSDEMNVLLDGIKAEAEALGIETATPDEIAEMKARWGVEFDTSTE